MRVNFPNIGYIKASKSTGFVKGKRSTINPWISFTGQEVQYIIELIIDLGEAWYQAGISQNNKDKEEIAAKLTDDLIAHIKFRRKIEL